MKAPDPIRLEWLCFADFSAAELYQALRFRQQIFVVEQRSPYADLDGLDKAARHLLLCNGDAIAGYLRLVPFRKDARVAIGRVAVASELRHRGFARLLMAEAMAVCERDYPHHAVTLSAQSYLSPFYERLGFVPVSPPYDDCGVPHIDMVLRS